MIAIRGTFLLPGFWLSEPSQKPRGLFCNNRMGKSEPFVCVPFTWLALPKSSRIFLHYLKKPKFCWGLQKTFGKDVKKHIKLFSAMYCAFPYLDRPFNYLFLRQKLLVEDGVDGWHRLPFSSVDFWQILDSFEKTHKIVACFSNR